jgi:hypothetical protein
MTVVDFSEKPVTKSLNPACPHCGKDFQALLWWDKQLKPDEPAMFRIFYCGQEDCRKILAITQLLIVEPVRVALAPGPLAPHGFKA